MQSWIAIEKNKNVHAILGKIIERTLSQVAKWLGFDPQALIDLIS